MEVPISAVAVRTSAIAQAPAMLDIGLAGAYFSPRISFFLSYDLADVTNINIPLTRDTLGVAPL